MITKNGYDLVVSKIDKRNTPIALINRNTGFQPWVVAWCYNEEGDYWGQGHYFSEFEEAVEWYEQYGKLSA